MDESGTASDTVVFSTRKVFDEAAVAKRMGLDASADLSHAILAAISELLTIDSAQQVRDSKGADRSQTIEVGNSIKISAQPTDNDSLPALLVSWAWEEEELATQVLVIINRVLG
ncbi:hypothetical protein LPJ62_002663 [Coemansia sp. RSA 2167]|nr:hypothetical protein LPJ62_002663 [Coemansia sp. RSA 2167]